MIEIDGTTGEGGGQILRSSLGLSLMTGIPFTIRNIRGKRKKTGLMRQHLTAVQAATQIGNAQVTGDTIRSSELSFIPQKPRGGKYHFSIGSAGSTTLVFQAILPGLLAAEERSTVIIEGGTHNPYAPPFDFLEQTFLPLLMEMGFQVTAEVCQPGFFPAGGGKVRFSVKPPQSTKRVDLLKTENITISAKALSSNLPKHVNRRELATVKKKLHILEDNLQSVTINSHGPGNCLSIFVKSDTLTETFTGFGEKNISAEKVAQRTVKQVLNYLETDAPVGPYLADQLLIPMALTGSGSFLTSPPSTHTVTNIDIIEQFLPVRFLVKTTETGLTKISIEGSI